MKHIRETRIVGFNNKTACGKTMVRLRSSTNRVLAFGS